MNRYMMIVGLAVVAAPVLAACGSTTAAVVPAAPPVSPPSNPYTTLDPILNSLVTDLSGVSAAAGEHNTVRLVSACESLSSDLGAAGTVTLPGEAGQHWANAVVIFKKAAADCVNGASTGDASMLMRVADELSAGNEEIGQVTELLRSVQG